ncbi:MAG TPA: hypothetical protein VL978_04765 [Puia sp.]|nr:hypothetical protein [Puia sp.]
MKLTFFLIAVFLILLRFCYPRLDLWHNGREQGTMITKGDNYIEGIWWSGKYRLSDDDRSIAEISPGGYLKFRENDTILKAESDLQGRITYTLNNGREELPLNDSGRNFMAAQIQKMIRLGFFGEERAERIYRQGGVPALLSELSRIRMEGGRDPYLNRLFRADTLTVPQRIELLQIVDSSTNTTEQQNLLSRFTRDQLRDSAVACKWLSAVGQLGQSYMKKDLLLQYLDTTVKPQEPLRAEQFDTVLAITGRFESPEDQKEILERLIGLSPGTTAGWTALIRATGALQPDYIKSELLPKIASKMPRTDSLRAAFRMAAKSIQSDNDYGKVMRAVE